MHRAAQPRAVEDKKTFFTQGSRSGDPWAVGRSSVGVWSFNHIVHLFLNKFAYRLHPVNEESHNNFFPR